MMEARPDRRGLLKAGGAVLALGALPAARFARARGATSHPIKLSVKYGMVGTNAPRLADASMADKFQLLKRIGFDGVELESPASYSTDEVRTAVAESGLPVHGVVDSVHWNKRLSSPDEAVRREGVDALAGAIRDVKAFGGSSVLLVPGKVGGEDETQELVWERSIAGIREVLSLASEHGIHILIENVWNGFCYDHGGPANQTADKLAEYIDAIDSPWVGVYHDIGNHQRFGKPADWIRRLGRRVVKLDVKGWGIGAGFCRIGDGDIDWPDVRKALNEIGFSGWATAEVAGGDEARLAEIKERMEKALRG